MDVVVVYESLLSNTRAGAPAITAGMGQADPTSRVMLMRAADAKPGDTESGSPVLAARMRGSGWLPFRRPGRAAGGGRRTQLAEILFASLLSAPVAPVEPAGPPQYPPGDDRARR